MEVEVAESLISYNFLKGVHIKNINYFNALHGF
jgi:hypothetical protein